jgi:hypothetical protein
MKSGFPGLARTLSAIAMASRQFSAAIASRARASDGAGVSAACHLQADNAVNDQQMAPPEGHPGSELTVQGVFENRDPWNGVATVSSPPAGGDLLGQLLADCAQRLQGVVSVVTLPNFDLTEDE